MTCPVMFLTNSAPGPLGRDRACVPARTLWPVSVFARAHARLLGGGVEVTGTPLSSFRLLQGTLDNFEFGDKEWNGMILCFTLKEANFFLIYA